VYLRCLILGLVLGGAAPTAQGLNVLDARVARTAGGYQVDFSVHLAGEAVTLERLLTDYARFSELSPTIVSSRILRVRGHGEATRRSARVELTLRPCVLIVFCRTVVKVSDVFPDESGRRVNFIAVPALSDFHAARETVAFQDVPAGEVPRVRLTYSAFLKPKFFVPPFVGPWLVRHHIIKDLQTTSERVEAVLQEQGGGS